MLDLRKLKRQSTYNETTYQNILLKLIHLVLLFKSRF